MGPTGPAGVSSWVETPQGLTTSDNVTINGGLTVAGPKAFLQAHPSDPTRAIRFVCLEGNESGTYFRGSSQTVAGRVVLQVPQNFRHVTDPDGLTVQLTPRGPAVMWVESVDLQSIVVRSTSDVSFDYFVNGVRRGFADLEIVIERPQGQPDAPVLPAGAGSTTSQD